MVDMDILQLNTPLGWALVVAAYLIGSIATAVVVARLAGIADPRTQGSGNPGATNVLRLGGKRLAALTLLGDLIKGFMPVALAAWLGGDSALLALVALAAFSGHLYPVWFGFRGGKGVATALGVLLGLCWPVALVVLACWIVVALLSRMSSPAALTAAFIAPAAMAFFSADATLTAAVTVMSVLLWWRHRSNLLRLLKGEEKKF